MYKLQIKVLKIIVMLILLFQTPIISEEYVDSAMFNDKISLHLEKAIFESSSKHAIYSYNIANASTPGFSPILFPDDQAELNQFFPDNERYFSKVVIEHIMTKMTENKVRYTALYALYKKKLDNWRQVATLGKR